MDFLVRKCQRLQWRIALLHQIRNIVDTLPAKPDTIVDMFPAKPDTIVDMLPAKPDTIVDMLPVNQM
jgi:hypothetical protein